MLGKWYTFGKSFFVWKMRPGVLATAVVLWIKKQQRIWSLQMERC